MVNYTALDNLLASGPLAVYQQGAGYMEQAGASLLQNSILAARQTMLTDQALIQGQNSSAAPEVCIDNGGDGAGVGGTTSYISWSTDGSGRPVATLVQDGQNADGTSTEIVTQTTYYGSTAPSGFPTSTADPSYVKTTDQNGNTTERWQNASGQVFTKYTDSGGTVTYSVTTAPTSTQTQTGGGQADQYYEQHKSSAKQGKLSAPTTAVSSASPDPLTTMAAVFNYSETYAQAVTTITTFQQCSIDAFKTIPH